MPMRNGDHRNRWQVRVLLALFTACCSLQTASAQEEPEYRLELGAGGGAVTYLGDYNGNLTKGMQPWGSLQARYKMNPRMAVGLTIGIGQIKGSSDHVQTWYPQERYDFSNSLTDVSLHFEYNFWAYGTGQEYRGAQRLAPFISLGLGAVHHGGAEKGLAASVPLGAGLKYKIGQRMNLTAEWRMHFSTSDRLDGVSDPYGIKSSGIFKNTDCYAILLMTLTYDLWERCKTCNNDRY